MFLQVSGKRSFRRGQKGEIAYPLVYDPLPLFVFIWSNIMGFSRTYVVKYCAQKEISPEQCCLIFFSNFFRFLNDRFSGAHAINMTTGPIVISSYPHALARAMYRRVREILHTVGGATNAYSRGNCLQDFRKIWKVKKHFSISI